MSGISAAQLLRLASIGLTRKQFAAVVDLLAEIEQTVAPQPPRYRSKSQRFVYVAGTSWEQPVKLGFSRNPWARVKELATGSATPIVVLAVFKTDAASEVELHSLLADHRSHREWFRIPADTAAVFRSVADNDEGNYDALLIALRSHITSLRSDTTAPPPKERSPEPPRETTPSSEELASLASSVEPKFELIGEAEAQPNGIVPYPEDFEELWREYRFVGQKTASKSAANKAFAKLTASDKKACYAGLLDYIQLVVAGRAKRPDYPVKHLATFINERGWEPFLEDVA